MTEFVPKSYTKKDYLLELKEIQDKINLEKIKFEKLERDNTQYENGLDVKKKKNIDLFEKEKRELTELDEKKTILSRNIDSIIEHIKEKGEMLSDMDRTLMKGFEELSLLQGKIRTKEKELDREDRAYKTKIEQIEKDIDKKSKECSLIVVEDMKIIERSESLDSREKELESYNEELIAKEQMLLNKEKVLKRYIYRLKLKFPDVEIKHI